MSSLRYRGSSSKREPRAGPQLASIIILPAKAARLSLRHCSLLCKTAVNSSPVPSIQVEQTLTFIAVCCYLFSCLIYCFTLLVGFSSNGFVWHSANLPCSWPEGRLLVFACLQYKRVSKSALTSLIPGVGDRVKGCSKTIQKMLVGELQQGGFWPVYKGQSGPLGLKWISTAV